MTDPVAVLPGTRMRIGIAADHEGFALKQQLTKRLRGAHFEVVDFGDSQPNPDDDYPD
jgi:ribose 5-phosphate isomerase B